MYRILLMWIILSSVNCLLFAQPDTLWTRTFGGNRVDYGRSVQETSDGGFIVAGNTGAYIDYDIFLLKTDADGDSIWAQTYGGIQSDEANCVQQTEDSGYIIVGKTLSYGSGNDDVYLLKTNDSGIEEWHRTFGGAAYDWGNSVQQTSDGGYIITGGTESYGTDVIDVWLIKTDSSGREEWTQTFGGNGWDEGCCVQQTADTGYIIAGYTDSFGAGYDDVYLIKHLLSCLP